MQTLHATLSQLITVEGHNGSYKMLGKAKTANVKPVITIYAKGEA